MADRLSYRDDPAVPAFPDDLPLVVYDGVCGLCGVWVRFILRRDGARVRHRFASAQSVLGSALYRHAGYDPAEPETLLVVANGWVHTKRDAVALVLAGLGFPWTVLARLVRLVPRSLAEWAYDRIARHRYRIGGRSPVCLRPPPGTTTRFLA